MADLNESTPRAKFLKLWTGHGAPNRHDEGDGHDFGVSVPEVDQGVGGTHTFLHNPWKIEAIFLTSGNDLLAFERV